MNVVFSGFSVHTTGRKKKKGINFVLASRLKYWCIEVITSLCILLQWYAVSSINWNLMLTWLLVLDVRRLWVVWTSVLWYCSYTPSHKLCIPHLPIWSWVRRKEGVKAEGRECKLTSAYWLCPPSSSSQLRSDHKMVKKDTNIYLPNGTNFFDSVLQKTVSLWIYLCRVWVNSATYVTCKVMKQDCLIRNHFWWII